MKINWKLILRVIAVISLIVAICWVCFQPGFEPLLTFLTAVGAFIGSFFVPDTSTSMEKPHSQNEVSLIDVNCGNKGIDLGNQRLRVSAAFGSYFLGLLEREQNYIPLSGQIECSTDNGQEGLSPIQRIFWSLHNPKGAQILILAADGGMGKSTLASKLVRCLYEQNTVSLILGDSAKSEMADPVSGKLLPYTPAYQTHSGFCKRLCMQLGVPYENDETAVKDIRRRLVDRNAVIVVDNLESVTQGDLLLQTLLRITGRDIRAIVTTRQVNNLLPHEKQFLLVLLHPLQNPEVVSKFVNWHIDQYQQTHPDLIKIRSDTREKKQMQWLIDKSGGVPLLIQLLVSDVARSSWEQMNLLPKVFGIDLLNFLYETRWKELQQINQFGLLAQDILLWINQEQNSNRRVTSKRLTEWAQVRGKSDELSTALTLLHERFLIINNDIQKGNYAIFPSLSEFLLNQRKIVI